MNRTPEQQQAHAEGYKSGRADYRLAYRSEYAWWWSTTEPEYKQHYSQGYQSGWLTAQMRGEEQM
jgi:hypothetical protein